MSQYLSTDPNAGQYLSTDPNAGLAQGQYLSTDPNAGSSPPQSGDSYDQYMPSSAMSPQEEKQAVVQAAQQYPAAENMAGAVVKAAEATPQFVGETLPRYAYQGLKIASGNTPPAQAIMEAVTEAAPQGLAMGQGLQSPVGSPQWSDAALQAAMMAAPGLELFKGVHPGVEMPVERPPVQIHPDIPATVDPSLADAMRSRQPDIQQALSGMAPETPTMPTEAPLSTFPDLAPEEMMYNPQRDLSNAQQLLADELRINGESPVSAAIRESVIPGLQEEVAKSLQPEPAAATLPTQDEFARAAQTELAPGDIAAERQQPQIPPEDARYSGVAVPEDQGLGTGDRQAAGTSNRQNIVTYGENAVPSGTGVDTGELLDNARTAISSGAADPYSVLSKTRASGIASPVDYATLAAEHERLVNDAVAKQKANDPSAPEAAQQAEDFANAIQPHKTAASDLFRLMQGDLNYDLSTPFGMDQYMKSELGRGIKPAEAPRFNRMSSDIRRGETDVQQAVSRSDARVQGHYAKVADIPMEEAAARVKAQLGDCLV